MIINYITFTDQITAIIKLRSKNFVNTNCDIANLISMVYTDIMNEVNLTYEKYPYTISDDKIITLTNEKLDTDGLTVLTIYKEVFDIVDEHDDTLGKQILKTDNSKYRYVDDLYREDNKGKTIYFVRSTIPAIDSLDSKMYNKMFVALVEGLMYHIQASIPDTADGQIINLQYQRYYAAKKELLNSLPQVAYIPKHANERSDYGDI